MFVSSHLINEMSLTAERLVVIGRGTPHRRDERRRSSPPRTPPRRCGWFTPCPGRLCRPCTGPVRRRDRVDGDGAIVVTGMTSAEVGELAAQRSLTMHELIPLRASLEDAFMELTHDSVEFQAMAAHLAAPLAMASSIRSQPEGGIVTNLIVPLAGLPDRPCYGLKQVMRAELTKIASLRSTLWTLLVTVVGTLGVTRPGRQRRTATAVPWWYQGFDPTNQVADRPGPGHARHRRARRPLGHRGVRHRNHPLVARRRSSPWAVPGREGGGGRCHRSAGGRAAHVQLALRLGQAILSAGGAPSATLGQAGRARAP